MPANLRPSGGQRKDGAHTADTHLPILAMTAFTMTGDRERFLEAGFDGYVRKPIDVRELFRSIRAAVPEARRTGSRLAMPTLYPPATKEDQAMDTPPVSTRAGSRASTRDGQ